MSSADKWTVALGIAGIMVNIALFGGLLAQLRQFKGANDLDHQRRKREATDDFLMATFNNARDLRAKGLPELFRSDVVPYASNPLDFGDERNQLIRHYLNEFESLATGVNLGVYDDEVVHALRGTTIVRAWALFSPWIQARRDFIKQPDLYEELEKMAGRMQEIQAARARPPIDVVGADALVRSSASAQQWAGVVRHVVRQDLELLRHDVSGEREVVVQPER